MGCKDASGVTGVYRPRQPRDSPLYQCVINHYEELDRSEGIHRSAECTVVDRFLICGDFQHGFTRLHCDECGRDYLFAFSCKTRYFCPNCEAEMRLIAVIEQSPVIERILRHIGVWDEHPPLREPPDSGYWPPGSQIPITYEPLLSEKCLSLTSALIEERSSFLVQLVVVLTFVASTYPIIAAYPTPISCFSGLQLQYLLY